jgi:hypothetical protein
MNLQESIRRILKEETLKLDMNIICDECGWSWKLSEGGNDPYTCHKCGNENSKSELTEKCWDGYTQKGMKTMFNTVTIKNNFDELSTEEPLNEIERDWRDKDYTDEYPKFRDRMLPILDKLVKSYGEDDKGNLSLFNDDEGTKVVFNYRLISKELYYDNSISQYFTDYLPFYLWARHGKYLIYDYFKLLFPDVEVKYVTPANII